MVKRGKKDSTPPIGKEEKAQLTKTKQKLRASEEQVQMQAARITRLEGKEDNMEKPYEELKEKGGEKLEDYDNLRSLKRATFNHFLSKWENANEEKTKDEISELKNAFPLGLRKFFSEEIKADKDSLN